MTSDGKSTIEGNDTRLEAAATTKAMVARFYLDMEIDRDRYYELTQDERSAAVASLEALIYCPADMDQIRSDWAAAHPLDMTGFSGVAEAAYAASATQVNKYILVACQNPSVEFPALGAGFDGVTYTILNGRRKCTYDYKLIHGNEAARFQGEHALEAVAVFRCEVEPEN